MAKVLKGQDHSDIKVHYNDNELPQDGYNIIDSSIQLTQQGFQFIKSIAKRAYYKLKDVQKEM